MKHKLHSLYALTRAYYLMWIFDTRTISAFVLTVIFVHMNTNEIIPLIKANDIGVSPWFFPFITSTRIVRTFLLFLLMFLICDIGKARPIDIAVKMRVKTFDIRLAKLMELFLRTAFYWSFVLLLPIAFYFPYMTWTSRWGKAFGYLARVADYEALGDFAIRVSSKIVDGYKPLLATVLSFSLCVLSGVLLGMIILVFEHYTYAKIGIVVSSFFILTDFWIETDIVALPKFIYISFCTYSNLNYLSSNGFGSYVLTSFKALMVDSISIILLSCIYLFAPVSEINGGGNK